MKIEYLHASKFGNGAMVAEEFKNQMEAKGVTVSRSGTSGKRGPRRLSAADLYLFSSPGRMGKPMVAPCAGSSRRWNCP